MRDQEIISRAQHILEMLENSLDEMRPKERDFVEDMILSFEEEEKSITEKQYRWLCDLIDKY